MVDVQRYIICPSCPNVYTESEIKATHGDESKRLADILGSSNESHPTTTRHVARRAIRRLLTPEPLSDDASDRDALTLASQRQRLANIDRLQDWTFSCPAGHMVDGNRGYQIPVAIIGPSGSSKSHFLPGLIWETDVLRALSGVGVNLRAAQFTSAQLKYSMRELYEEKRVLDPTPSDAMLGPFGYRLSIRTQNSEDRYSLLLFDVGGEALSTIAKIRQQATFVLLAQAVVILIDPEGVVLTRFDEPDLVTARRKRLIAASKVRDSIALVADALEELWGAPMTDIPIPACFVIAKADCISWLYDWDTETAGIVNAAQRGADLRTLLMASSERVKSEFYSFGGGPIIDEIAERFPQERVRFVAASATSEMPTPPAEPEGKPNWDDPRPNGVALALLQVLDLLEKIKPDAGTSAGFPGVNTAGAFRD